MRDREEMIRNYVNAYNAFDVDKMIADFDDSIVFENVSDGKTDLTLTGLSAFKAQAEKAKDFFSSRKQTIQSFLHAENRTEIEIDYEAMLAIDLPNGLKKGEALKLSGKSVFEFSDNKIAQTDRCELKTAPVLVAFYKIRVLGIFCLKRLPQTYFF